MAGILAKKLGMTQVFTKDGRCLAVTIVQAGPCTVIQKKTTETDGYNSVQLGFDEIEPRKLDKAQKAHFQKKELKPFAWLKEFRINNIDDYQVGQVLTVNRFKEGDTIAVTGVSKGKGFQGVIKRHHKRGGPKSHGSTFHRSTGSIGQRTYPGKVFKNMKLPGHMGDEKVTVKNLEVVGIRPEENLLYIYGAVPGATNAYVIIHNLEKDFDQRKEEVSAPEASTESKEATVAAE